MEENTTVNQAPCELKRGFFVLRPCRRPAGARCSSCKRLACARHVERHADTVYCSDCYAKRTDSFADSGDYYYRDSWRHGYRDGYYSSTSYNPIVLGGSSSGAAGASETVAGGGGEFGGGGASGGWDDGDNSAPQFDESDVAAFDGDGATGFDEDGDGGLFDS